jgi:hypothetical protein
MKIMKKTILFLSILSLLALSSCKKKKVTSCIGLDKSSISSGQSIIFTSCSENELSYYWSIDGPDSAAENNMVWNDKQITVPFTTAGTYYITLDSYSEFSFLGDKATSSATFIVN